jgi:hypothetical protein
VTKEEFFNTSYKFAGWIKTDPILPGIWNEIGVFIRQGIDLINYTGTHKLDTNSLEFVKFEDGIGYRFNGEIND